MPEKQEQAGFSYTPVQAVNQDFASQCWGVLDNKTIPPRSMGALERLAVRLACIQQSLSPDLGIPHVIIAAGDHGVYAQKVSFAPRSVTWQHSLNMLNGGGVAGLFAHKYGMPFSLCDVGVDHDFAPDEGVVDCKVRYGSGDISLEPAMSREECLRAMVHGRDQVAAAYEKGARSVIFGEMGIGNTTPASALAVAILGLPVSQAVGAGTGMGDNALRHKREVVEKAVKLHGNSADPIELMARLGGLELAFMMGGVLEAAGRGMVILLDGFIVTAAALAAYKLEPRVSQYMVACHCSKEGGHGPMLREMGLEPLLRLELCLGEGSGAIIAWPLVQSALAIFNEVTSYDEGGLDNATATINEARDLDGHPQAQ